MTDYVTHAEFTDAMHRIDGRFAKVDERFARIEARLDQTATKEDVASVKAEIHQLLRETSAFMPGRKGAQPIGCIPRAVLS